MDRVFKYQLAVTDAQVVVLPSDARILTVQMQGDTACMWALVNPENPHENRTIEIYGTGHPVTDAEMVSYISTFQMHGGSLIFHAFERLEN